MHYRLAYFLKSNWFVRSFGYFRFNLISLQQNELTLSSMKRFLDIKFCSKLIRCAMFSAQSNEMVHKSFQLFSLTWHKQPLLFQSFFTTQLKPAGIEILMRGLPNLSLKIGTGSAICWNYLGLSRDYGLSHIFLGIKLFCFSR